jgi:hypothetical protein
MAAGVPVCAQPIPAHRLLLGPELDHLLVDFAMPEEAAERLRSLLRLAHGPAKLLATRLRHRAAGYGIDRLRDQIDGLYIRLGLTDSGV